ncbi:MAG: PAS domain S-box protein [Deltaproteobacteria bacterium]|nr:PAS domain S-box protein [Deltaproteobacteria bacterium]
MEDEKDLDGLNAVYRNTVYMSYDAIVSAGEDGRVVLFNPAAMNMFGYTETEALDMNVEAFMPEEYRERHHVGMEYFLKTGKGPLIGKVSAVEGLKKDGSRFPADLSLSAERIGGAWVFTAVIRDVTSRLALEKDIKDRLLEMERLNRLMVGRELKMEELRQEIRELREKIDKAGL